MRGEKWSLDRTGTPEGWLRGGMGSHTWRDPWGLRSGGAHPAYPLPNQPGKSAWLSGWVLCPQRPSLGCVCPGGIGGRPGESRRGRQVGSSRTRGAVEERRAFAPPTQAQEVCWATKWGRSPSETRGGEHAWAPFALLRLNPNPHNPHPTGPFPAL